MARTVEVAPDRYARWRERFDAANPDGPQRVLGIEAGLAAPFAVLLVRRGGYAVALVDAHARLVHAKVGTRHVQSRTAAGGWSQQRFARRREGQASALTQAVAGHAALLITRGSARAVAVGGDRTLVREVLIDPRLTWLEDLPRREFYDIPDPRRAVLETVIVRAQAIRAVIDDGDRRG